MSRRAMGQHVVAALLASGLVACAATGPHSRAAGIVGSVAVRPVAWNVTNAPVGRVRAVADAGDVVAVFAEEGATVLSSRAVVATDSSVKGWVDADTIYGADGAARWIVGIDGRGHVYYLRNRSSFEDVTERYGLGGAKVLAAAVLGPATVGFLLDGEVALADGHKVTRYGTSAFHDLVGGGGFGVGVASDQLHVLSAAEKTMMTFALPTVTHAALGPKGRLYAMTPKALYAANDHGELVLLYEADGRTLHGLVASGEHVWFADGSELGVVDDDRIAETTGAHVPKNAKLAASSSGDVWVLSDGALQRFARIDPEPSLNQAWNSTLAPIFGRSCAACHLPNGPSGTDLSNAEAWQSERAEIHDRVVSSRSMPPEGHMLSEADRAAIAAWVETKGPR